MRELSRWLVWVAIGFSVLVPALGVLIAGRPIREMILIGLTLAFATIAEELPILITIVLGIGAYRLAQRHAIVKHLRAAETLGSVSVVATDKTGTLTENRMRVVAVVADGEERGPRDAVATTTGRRVLEVGVLANDAQLATSGGSTALVGDPTETALIAAAQEAVLDVEEIRGRTRVVEECPFDDHRKRMSVVVEDGNGRVLALKGAPEWVLANCTAVRDRDRDPPLDDSGKAALQARVDDLAVRGLRTLALAERRLTPGEGLASSAEQVEHGLTLLGLVALEDPPRAGAREAVAALQGAGVRVLMVTGDHPATARAIADRVGIDATRAIRGRELDAVPDEELSRLARTASVFARIAPEHKLRVVRALQAGGEAVAVTGDGVNDAPALREATIGVAMGKGGTDVAREAADLVLADDDFATVTEAVRTGRVLFANLRKAVRYYLAAKVALVSSSLVAVLLKLPVPFEPVQIIIMELFMDLGASVTFVAEPPEEDVMLQPPRAARARFRPGDGARNLRGRPLARRGGAGRLLVRLGAQRQRRRGADGRVRLLDDRPRRARQSPARGAPALPPTAPPLESPVPRLGRGGGRTCRRLARGPDAAREAARHEGRALGLVGRDRRGNPPAVVVGAVEVAPPPAATSRTMVRQAKPAAAGMKGRAGENPVRHTLASSWQRALHPGNRRGAA